MVHTLSIVLSSSILIAAFSLYLVHWFRRSVWQTRSPTIGAPGTEGGETAGFDRVQRLFHWSVTIVTVALAFSGLILYYPAFVAPFLNSLGVPVHAFLFGWVNVHVIGAVILLGLIVVHIAWDSLKLRTTKLVVPIRQDAREAIVRAWRFVWGGSPTPRSSKYDVFMKSYHILLTVCSLGLGVTGFVQYVWAPWWRYPEILHLQVEPWWKPTILHDWFGFTLIALVVGHTYFSLLPTNKKLFFSMIRGRAQPSRAAQAQQPVSAPSSGEPPSRQRSAPRAMKRLAGVGAVGLLTYIGEYASFIVVLAFLSDQLTISFGLGTSGYALIGTISGAYLVLSGLIAIPVGHLCDKYGRRRFTIIGCLLAAAALISLIFLAQISNLLEFAIGMGAALIALGAAHGIYTASTLAYTGDLAAQEGGMGKSFGLIEGAEFAGYAFGPALGTTIGFLLRSRAGVFETSAFMLLAAAAVAFLFMPEIVKSEASRAESHREAAERAPGVSVAEDLPGQVGDVHEHSVSWADFLAAFKIPIIGVALLTTFVGSIGFSGFFYYVPLYANFLKSSIPIFSLLYGWFASIMAATAVILMVPFGHLEDRGKRRMPYLVAGLVLGALSLAFVFFTPSVPSFVVASVAFGFSIAMVRVSQLVLLAENSTSSSRAAIMGTNHAVEHAGYGVASFLVGVAVALLGFVGAFRTLSIVLLVAGVGFLLYARKKKVK